MKLSPSSDQPLFGSFALQTEKCAPDKIRPVQDSRFKIQQRPEGQHRADQRPGTRRTADPFTEVPCARIPNYKRQSWRQCCRATTTSATLGLPPLLGLRALDPNSRNRLPVGLRFTEPASQSVLDSHFSVQKSGAQNPRQDHFMQD